MHFRTLREVPTEAEIPSHILLLRAGMIKKTAAGIYSYMPMGWRTIRKIEQIVREEMDAKGAEEIYTQSVQPAELWKESGRLRTETRVNSASVRRRRRFLQIS